PESEFYKTMSRRTSSVTDTFQELESVGGVMTRFKLDMTCVCEKLANLNLLLMHMETVKSDFEVFVSNTNPNTSDLEFKALEFDFLYGFLTSEVSVLKTLISDFQADKSNMQEFMASRSF
ncbi:WPP domain-interacting tail-anchored protein 1-like protein, partial [Tanacetum coccineum]